MKNGVVDIGQKITKKQVTNKRSNEMSKKKVEEGY